MLSAYHTTTVRSESPMGHRIDVHHHVIPPVYQEAVDHYAGGTQLDGVDPVHWDRDTDLEVMDRHGIDMALLTVTAPGATLAGDDAPRLARQVNEYMAELVRDTPSRYGALTLLPLPDVDAAIAELDYALDELGHDGVGLYTHYDGVYLGDPRLDRIIDHIAERGVGAHVHPAIPASDPERWGLPPSLYEFTFDTTRATANLLFSGTLDRHPDLKLILSHAGGTVPYLAKRLTYASTIASDLKDRQPEDLLGSLRRLYYDTAMSANPATLAGLTALIDDTHILFGSDFPYMPESTTAETVSGLEDYFDRDALARIDLDNYRDLFPRAVERL